MQAVVVVKATVIQMPGFIAFLEAMASLCFLLCSHAGCGDYVIGVPKETGCDSEPNGQTDCLVSQCATNYCGNGGSVHVGMCWHVL